MDVTPVDLGGRILIPVRFATEPLGAKIDWLESEQKVTVTLGSNVVELWIGKNTAKVNGIDKLIDPNNPKVMPMIIDNRTMIPIRFLSENLGCTVDWDAIGNKATITYPK